MTAKPNKKLVFLNTCVLCDKPGIKKCGSCFMAHYCGTRHQTQHWKYHKIKCKIISIQESSPGVLSAIAAKNIPAGTLIIEDYPIFMSLDPQCPARNLLKILEVAESLPFPCPGCFNGKILQSSLETFRCKRCGVPVCSSECEKDCRLYTPHSNGECAALREILREVLNNITHIM